MADNPSRTAQLNAGAYALVNHLFYQRTLQIVGADRDTSKRVSDLLPQQNSNFWWISHLSTIERVILADAYVAAVSVSICRNGWIPRPGCFSIEITPRKAEYLVLAAAQLRLVADDGVVLESIAAADFKTVAAQLISADGRAPKVLRGIYSDQPSSDIAAARFSRVVSAIKQLELQLARRVDSVEFINSGEIEVQLAATRYPIRFNIDSLTSLNDQADRFARLEREIASKIDLVEMVDMAFDKLGVVRYSQTVIGPAAPKEAKKGTPSKLGPQKQPVDSRAKRKTH